MHKQGSLLTYIKTNTSFSQLNASNNFLIELIKVCFSMLQQLHITKLYIPSSYHKQNHLNYNQHIYNCNKSSKHNYHSRCQHSLNVMVFAKDHRRELIKDILLNSCHITLSTNTPTCLPPNQTQQSTSPDIITASADLHDCNSWQTIHFPHPITYLYSPSSIYIIRPKNSLSLQ